jgi:hypothetical protein
LSGNRKATFLLFGCVVMLAGCGQANNYTYSKKNFTSPIFEADLSECKRHRSPITAYQGVQREIREPQVRDCMKTKGYRIETEVQ